MIQYQIEAFKNHSFLNFKKKLSTVIFIYILIMQLDLVIFNSLFLLLSLLGVFLRRYNILIILICIELSLLALSLIFISLSYYLDNIIGKIFTLFILTLAATESALGLGILLAFFRTRGFILLEGFTTLKN